MKHDADKSSQQAAVELGALLQTERVKRHLSIGDVSEQLKLPTRQIEALEQADFSKLPEPVFIRGFLRSYGRYLNLDEAVLNAYLDQIVKRPETAAVVGSAVGATAAPVSALTEKRGIPSWIFGVLTGCLIVGGIYFWQSKSQQNAREQAEAEQAVSETARQPVLPPNVDSSSVQIVAIASDSYGDDLTEASAPEQSASATAENDGRLTTDAGELAIRLRFRSFLTVNDAEGKTLISRIVSANSEHRFRDGGPYRVRIGFAKDSTVSYGGRDINVADHMRDSKTAVFDTADTAP